MKIYIALPNGKNKNLVITPEIRERLSALGEVEENNTDRQVEKDEINKIAKNYDAIITSWGMPCIKAADLKDARLKFIGHIGGTVQGLVDESVFDTDIFIVSGNGAFPPALAESTLLLMLMSLKRWHEINYKMKSGDLDWHNSNIVESLFNKTVGLLGFGQIAKKLISLLKPFNVRILVADDYVTEQTASELGFEISGIDEVLSKSDVISIHHTLTEATFHLLNKDRINLLKPSAVIINTSRGSIIDEKALIERLKKGELFAALDVYEKEPLDIDSPLRCLDNTIIIPHMGGKTTECRYQLSNIVITQLENFAKGRPVTDYITFDSFKRMTKKI